MPERIPTPEEQAVDCLIARLKRIAPDNGYRTDLGSRVYWQWANQSERQATTLQTWLSVADDEASPGQSAAGTFIEAMTHGRPYEWTQLVTIEASIYLPASSEGDDADRLRLRALVNDIREDVEAAILDPGAVPLAGADSLSLDRCAVDFRPPGQDTTALIWSATLSIPKCRGRSIK